MSFESGFTLASFARFQADYSLTLDRPTLDPESLDQFSNRLSGYGCPLDMVVVIASTLSLSHNLIKSMRQSNQSVVEAKQSEIDNLTILLGESLSRPSTIIEGDYVTGDQNNNSGMIGNQGGKGNTNSGDMSQTIAQQQTNIDLTQLGHQLTTLYKEMEKDDLDEPDHAVSIGLVKAAAKAADKGLGGKALEYIAKAGNTVLDYASKLSIPIVVEFYKNSLK